MDSAAWLTECRKTLEQFGKPLGKTMPCFIVKIYKERGRKYGNRIRIAPKFTGAIVGSEIVAGQPMLLVRVSVFDALVHLRNIGFIELSINKADLTVTIKQPAASA